MHFNFLNEFFFSKKENVMSRLAKISYQCIKKTGFFQSHTPYYMNHLDPDPDYKQLERISVSGDKNFGKKGYEKYFILILLFPFLIFCDIVICLPHKKKKKIPPLLY